MVTWLYTIVLNFNVGYYKSFYFYKCHHKLYLNYYNSYQPVATTLINLHSNTHTWEGFKIFNSKRICCNHPITSSKNDKSPYWFHTRTSSKKNKSSCYYHTRTSSHKSKMLLLQFNQQWKINQMKWRTHIYKCDISLVCPWSCSNLPFKVACPNY